MKIFPVLGISVIRLCKSSLGDKNGEKSGLIYVADTTYTGSGSGEHNSFTEFGNIFSETLMTLANNVNFGVEEGLEFGNLPTFLTNDKDERTLYQMIEEDVEAPVIEQDQYETNEDTLPTFPRYIEEDSFLKVLITSMFKPMVSPYIPPEHPSFDPSSVPIFTSPSSPDPEVNQGTERESPAVSFRCNDNVYYDGWEVPSLAKNKKKNNHSASTTAGKLEKTSNGSEAEIPQKNNEKKTIKIRKRRLELPTYKGYKIDESKSVSDKTESESIKRSKTALNSKLAKDDKERYISFKTFEAKKMRFEEDIRRCASFEEWVEEQHREARKKNETLDAIDILLKVLEGLGLVKGEDPYKRDEKRAFFISKRQSEWTG